MRDEQTTLPGTLIVVAPADPGTLLSIARDCARVGAGALLVPDGTSEDVLAAVRTYTSLVLCGDGPGLVPLPVGPQANCEPDVSALQFMLGTTDLPPDLHTVSKLLRTVPSGVAAIFGTRNGGGNAVLLSALAGGAHLRVGSADSGGDDTKLTAMASGLARLAGRPPLDPAAASVLLGIASLG